MSSEVLNSIDTALIIIYLFGYLLFLIPALINRQKISKTFSLTIRGDLYLALLITLWPILLLIKSLGDETY